MSTIVPIQFISIPVSSAQLLALQTTPIQILPGLGNNTMVNILWSSIQYDAGSVAYVDPSSATLFLSIKSGASFTDLQSIPVIGTFDSSVGTNVVTQNSLVPIEIFQALNTRVNNMPLVVRLDHAITTGNGSIILNVFYITVPLA